MNRAFADGGDGERPVDSRRAPGYAHATRGPMPTFTFTYTYAYRLFTGGGLVMVGALG